MNRRLVERAEHLLSKTHRPLRWVWVAGDCDAQDHTYELLQNVRLLHRGKDITIVTIETDPALNRYQRLSLTASRGLEEVRNTDHLVMLHESDIESSLDIVEQLLATEKMPVAAWPVLRLNGNDVFYDTWAFRRDGQKFSNYPPYHTAYHPGQPFEVDGVGTVWMFHAEDAWKNGLRCYEWCAVELCEKLRGMGRRLWVDPRVVVRQPADLWVPYEVPGR